MLKIEKELLKHIENNIDKYFLFIITLMAIGIRKLGITYVSEDMNNFLIPWYKEAIKLGQINSLSYEIGNYNIPYQTFIALLTYIPINPILGYKLFSIFFDFVLAISMGILITELRKENKFKYFIYIYTTVLFLPTVILNSSFWGQADSIYVSFIIISVILLKKEKYLLSFLILGFAFIFKLQTIFIMPIYAYYYFINKKFSIIKLLLFIILGAYSLCIPGLIYGRSILAPIKVYMGQAKDPFIWINFPSFWALLTPRYNPNYVQLIKYSSILLCGVILLIGLYYIIKNKVNFNDNKIFILISTWTVYTIVLFLVGMHDRYGYLLDLLFIIILFIKRELSVYWIIPFIIGIITYGNYLFLNQYMDEHIYTILSTMYLINYLLFTYNLIT